MSTRYAESLILALADARAVVISWMQSKIPPPPRDSPCFPRIAAPLDPVALASPSSLLPHTQTRRRGAFSPAFPCPPKHSPASELFQSAASFKTTDKERDPLNKNNKASFSMVSRTQGFCSCLTPLMVRLGPFSVKLTQRERENGWLFGLQCTSGGGGGGREECTWGLFIGDGGCSWFVLCP